MLEEVTCKRDDNDNCQGVRTNSHASPFAGARKCSLGRLGIATAASCNGFLHLRSIVTAHRV